MRPIEGYTTGIHICALGPYWLDAASHWIPIAVCGRGSAQVLDRTPFGLAWFALGGEGTRVAGAGGTPYAIP